jgi:hypothetical protein
MIDNVDQDEWFNLYLYLGSYWAKTSRDTRLDTILDTIPDTKSGPKPKRDLILDRAETENQSWTQGVSTRKSSWNQFVWGRRSLASSKSLTEEGSVRGRSLQSSSSTGSTKDQDQFEPCVVSLRRIDGFFNQYFQV